MHELVSIEQYLGELSSALSLSSGQRDDIVDEVRADLTDHIDRLIEAGKSKEEACQMAIAEIGNAYELAHKMQKVVAPKSSKKLNTLRYVVAAAIGLFALYFYAHLRAWEQVGFNPAMCTALLGFFWPALLLTWPGMIWRKNWLFFIYPGVVGLLLILLVVGMFGAVSSTGSIDLSADAVVQPEPAPFRAVYVVVAVLGLLIAATLAMIQRRRQQVIVLLSMVAFCAIVEVPYYIEEASFSAEAKQVAAYVTDYKTEHGQLPSEETVREAHPQRLMDMHFRYDDGADGEIGYCIISHPRWINRGHSLWYSSKTNEVGCWD